MAGSPPRRRWLRALAATAVVVLLVAGLAVHLNEPSLGASASAPVTLAVLPFAMLGLPEADRYLGIGIADAIITQLSGVPRLAVRPTSAVGGLGNGADSTVEGRRLQVANVLEGAIQRDGERLLVTVQLVDTLSATARWGERFEEPVSDAFALQDAIARKMALGEPEPALDALARCYYERCSSAPFLRQHPTFRPLHGDPRFEALALRLGLPPTTVPKPS
jgi:TolB-like protein